MTVLGLRLRFLFSWVVVLLFCARCAEAVTLYVSGTGNDAWSGLPAQPNTERTDGPLASLAGARDAIRRLKPRGLLDSPVWVIVLDGTYTLTEPLILTPHDSGTQQYPISYEAAAGARPVFTGGRVITGFERGENGIWQTHIPEVAAGRWHFEQLFIDGRRAVRARNPNKFYHYMVNIKQEILQKGSGRTATRARQTVEAQPEDIKPLLGLDKSQLNDVTMVVYHKWDNTRRFIDDVDAKTNAIITSGQGMKSWNPWKKGTRYHLENFKTALDAPSEWFLEHDWEEWDKQIQTDSESGKLDFLVQEAMNEKKQGRLRDL